MNNNARKTSLFLMELIIAILFFSLAATICIQLFVKSHMISERSIALNHSILLAQNTAEIFYATNGDPEKMASLLGCGESSGTAAIADSDNASTLTLFYTDKFDCLDPAEAASAVFQQTISLYADSDPALITCHIVISELSSGDVIYSLDTTLFQRSRP
ncbi:hypothetical protein [Suilimivivens sp.]|uniref:hypothetical protein n=1 Tax=Suilimivivens sp. TaxID=2981669 RepID=UPI00307CB093